MRYRPRSSVVAFGTSRLGTSIIRHWPLMTIGCLTVTCELATGAPNGSRTVPAMTAPRNTRMTTLGAG
jgi:hypothetical protein